MCPTDIELQKEAIQSLEKHIEELQAFKEKIATELGQLTVSKLLLQITKKSPELLAKIETHIEKGRQYEQELTERIASRKNLYQSLQFFTQTNDSFSARSKSDSDNPHFSSFRQEIGNTMQDIMTFK